MKRSKLTNKKSDVNLKSENPTRSSSSSYRKKGSSKSDSTSAKKKKLTKPYHTDRIHPSTKLELFSKMLEKGITNVRDVPEENKFEILEFDDEILGQFKDILFEKSLKIDKEDNDNIIPKYFVKFRIMNVEGSAEQIKVIKTLSGILINIINHHKLENGESYLYYPHPEIPTDIYEPDDENVIIYRIFIKGENGNKPDTQFKYLLGDLGSYTKLQHLLKSGKSYAKGDNYEIELNFKPNKLKTQIKQLIEEQKRREQEVTKEQTRRKEQLIKAKEQNRQQALVKIKKIKQNQIEKWKQKEQEERPAHKTPTPKKPTPKKPTPKKPTPS